MGHFFGKNWTHLQFDPNFATQFVHNFQVDFSFSFFEFSLPLIIYLLTFSSPFLKPPYIKT